MKEKYICPNCGRRCLHGGIGAKRKLVQPERCPECRHYILQRHAVRPRTKQEKGLHLLFSICSAVFAVSLFLCLLLLDRRLRQPRFLVSSLDSRYAFVFFVSAFLCLCGAAAAVIISMILSGRYPKRTFIEVDENLRPVPVPCDLRVRLDITALKHPDRVLYDYTAYDFCLADNKAETYPVLLFVHCSEQAPLYYTLYFPGKHAGFPFPALEPYQQFTITDEKACVITGSIEEVFPCYLEERAVHQAGMRRRFAENR